MCHFLDGRLKSLTFFPIRLCVMIIVIRRGKVLLFITSKSIWAISTCAAAAATATGGGTASILLSWPYSHYWKSTSKTEYTRTVFRNIKRLFHYTVTLFCIEFSVFLHCFFFIWKVLPVIFLLGCWNVASGLYQIEYRLFLKNRKKMENELEKWNGIDHKLLREISVLFCIGLVVLTLHCILNSLFLSFYFTFNCEKHGDKKKRSTNMLLLQYIWDFIKSDLHFDQKDLLYCVYPKWKKKCFLQNAMPLPQCLFHTRIKNTIWKSRLKIFSTNLNVWISG